MCISLDHTIEFIDQLVASGAFTQEQIWKMHSLMRAMDVLTQRFKVILDSEQTIARGGDVKPTAVWATNAHLELIPAAEIDLIGAEEKRAATRAERGCALQPSIETPGPVVFRSVARRDGWPLGEVAGFRSVRNQIGSSVLQDASSKFYN